jgi:hypothetical protein
MFNEQGCRNPWVNRYCVAPFWPEDAAIGSDRDIAAIVLAAITAYRWNLQRSENFAGDYHCSPCSAGTSLDSFQVGAPLMRQFGIT